MPETIVGRHPIGGQEMKAGIHGHVATLFFNLTHESLTIMIWPMGTNLGEK
jgi:hypothetical protein